MRPSAINRLVTRSIACDGSITRPFWISRFGTGGWDQGPGIRGQDFGLPTFSRASTRRWCSFSLKKPLAASQRSPLIVWNSDAFPREPGGGRCRGFVRWTPRGFCTTRVFAPPLSFRYSDSGVRPLRSPFRCKTLRQERPRRSLPTHYKALVQNPCLLREARRCFRCLLCSPPSVLRLPPSCHTRFAGPNSSPD